jgi:hypothetical protein
MFDQIHRFCRPQWSVLLLALYLFGSRAMPVLPSSVVDFPTAASAW